MISQYLIELKRFHRPENKVFPGMPNERSTVLMGYEVRKSTRPWDNCWFSNKPYIVSLTVEQAVRRYPVYMLWCYDNLNIMWSSHTIKLFKEIRPCTFNLSDLK